MEFDKSRIYTAVNADELHKGDKVIVADTVKQLIERIQDNIIDVLRCIADTSCQYRFLVASAHGGYLLAYLVERKKEPKYIPWTKENCPLGLGDKVVMKLTEWEFLITGYDRNSKSLNYYIYDSWFSYDELFEHFMKLDGSPCGMLIE